MGWGLSQPESPEPARESTGSSPWPSVRPCNRGAVDNKGSWLRDTFLLPGLIHLTLVKLKPLLSFKHDYNLDCGGGAFRDASGAPVWQRHIVQLINLTERWKKTSQQHKLDLCLFLYLCFCPHLVFFSPAHCHMLLGLSCNYLTHRRNTKWNKANRNFTITIPDPALQKVLVVSMRRNTSFYMDKEYWDCFMQSYRCGHNQSMTHTSDPVLKPTEI